MGVYLSAPIVEKESTNEECNGFTYGASSMQGWRVNQEDAHNCIPEFDKESETSFFAVYDGHGGAEVAKYCHLNFPDFVKSMVECSKDDDLINLIQSAFLQFDATLAEDDVVKKLKELAGKDDEDEEEEFPDVPVGRTETDLLKAEGSMPLDELLAKYSKSDTSATNEEVKMGEGSGCSSSREASSSSQSAAASSSHSINGPTKVESESKLDNDKSTASEASFVKESNKSNNGSGSTSSGSSACTSPSSGGSSALGQRASKTKALSDMPFDDGDDSSDEEEDEEVEEDMWEDMSDDEDDEDEEDEGIDNDVPTMDMTNEEPGSDSGCTACVVLKQKHKLIVANAGDSRCVLSRDGEAIELSFDHKPEDDPERERIEKAGGKVTADGRVNGGLNLSRAFGDHVYKRNKELPSKEQMISALPDVKTIELNDSDEFFIIACDGIWNSMSSQEVVDFVKERLSDSDKRKRPSLINEELFDHCLSPNILGDGTGCDNMTSIIVVLDSPPTTCDQSEHNDKTVESLNKTDPLKNEVEDEKNSLKRVTDNGEAEEDTVKRVKVSEGDQV